MPIPPGTPDRVGDDAIGFTEESDLLAHARYRKALAFVRENGHVSTHHTTHVSKI